MVRRTVRYVSCTDDCIILFRARGELPIVCTAGRNVHSSVKVQYPRCTTIRERYQSPLRKGISVCLVSPSVAVNIRMLLCRSRTCNKIVLFWPGWVVRDVYTGKVANETFEVYGKLERPPPGKGRDRYLLYRDMTGPSISLHAAQI
ncbi:hypothetical protein M501DRAFT_621326 [Patellaria atrata CBS 101060]|uniref:Uncharacterized protein n=1 Tax=Patellaria atrata CBS 101060 TaxID=1346257 RepID=A0A9P4VP97_9PEZI|nr:hypothetical protein M501DRAFT_621326 [Patellaria atrata CBS 101060]